MSLRSATLLLAATLAACVHGDPDAITAGSILSARNEQGEPVTLRIDQVESQGDLHLYHVAARDQLSGNWVSYCTPDAEGKRRAIPLTGTWDAAGAYIPNDKLITFACTSGVLAKCVRWGYKPWVKRSDVSMRDLHQTCTRMARADYCGNGTPHTRDGTTINMYDRFGIQSRDDDPSLAFEAAWGPSGAVYLNKTLGLLGPAPQRRGFRAQSRRCGV